MVIRRLEEKDLDEILRIEGELFTSPWKREDFLYELNDNPFSSYYVLVLDEKIIGYIGFWITFETAQITNIAIDEEFQQKGYGTLLMNRCIEEVEKAKCENITLEVRVGNHKAIALYERLGFIKANIRKGYYTDNHEDAYLMIKPLGGAYSE